MYIFTHFCRNSTQVQTEARHSEDPPDGEQHGGHLCQAGRLRPRQDLDLERRQLRVPRLHEGKNLKVKTLEKFTSLVQITSCGGQDVTYMGKIDMKVAFQVLWNEARKEIEVNIKPVDTELTDVNVVGCKPPWYLW